jgi:signal transduction histidine kinase/CheY-like chemotaxis protein
VEGRAIDQLAGTVLQHVQTAAIAADGDGRVGVFNAAAARVLRVQIDDVLGLHLDELARGDTAVAALAEVLRETRRTGETVARRQLTVTGHRGEQVLGYSASLLGDGVTAVFFADLTDTLAEEQRAAEAQRFAEVGRIASAMAHELKSPLATVELYASLLRRALAEDASSLERLDVIAGQTRLCLDRIGAIMHSINPELAKAGGMTLTPVVPLLREVVSDLRRRLEDATITLRGVSGEPRVALAENDLRSVVGNLIVNAVQASGGQARVTVTLAGDADRLTITVADRGPGLPDADVFEAFYTTKSSGTGLGLWLVRRLVEDAGGSIASGNRRGGGAVFTVRLPLPRHERLDGARVLLVEDDLPLRDVLASALEGCGARVTAAASGKDVPLDGERWDCATLDYHLRGMTGVDIATRLAPGTPVLLVSSDPAAGAALAEVRDRRAWYRPKPVEVELYLDLVSLLLGAT